MLNVELVDAGSCQALGTDPELPVSVAKTGVALKGSSLRATGAPEQSLMITHETSPRTPPESTYPVANGIQVMTMSSLGSI